MNGKNAVGVPRLVVGIVVGVCRHSHTFPFVKTLWLLKVKVSTRLCDLQSTGGYKETK